MVWSHSCWPRDPGTPVFAPKEEMATHSSILTWEIPWTEEAGGPQFIGLQESDMTEVTKNMTFT